MSSKKVEPRKPAKFKPLSFGVQMRINQDRSKDHPRAMSLHTPKGHKQEKK